MSWWQMARAVWAVLKPSELNPGEQQWIEQQRHDRELLDKYRCDAYEPHGHGPPDGGRAIDPGPPAGGDGS